MANRDQREEEAKFGWFLEVTGPKRCPIFLEVTEVAVAVAGSSLLLWRRMSATLKGGLITGTPLNFPPFTGGSCGEVGPPSVSTALSAKEKKKSLELPCYKPFRWSARIKKIHPPANSIFFFPLFFGEREARENVLSLFLHQVLTTQDGWNQRQDLPVHENWEMGGGGAGGKKKAYIGR